MNGDPAQADASLDERYRRLVRRARCQRLIPALCAGAAVYLPAVKGEVRFLDLDHLSWSDAVEKTLVWVLIMGFMWVLPFDMIPSPSGYGGLDRTQRAAVDEALRLGRPPSDPFLRRVTDAYAAMLMKRGEPSIKDAVVFALVAVAVCVLALQWWVLVLWLGTLAFVAMRFWRTRGLPTQAERYLTAPRRFVSGQRIAEVVKDAPRMDAAVFRRDLDELIDRDPFPRG